MNIYFQKKKKILQIEISIALSFMRGSWEGAGVHLGAVLEIVDLLIQGIWALVCTELYT